MCLTWICNRFLDTACNLIFRFMPQIPVLATNPEINTLSIFTTRFFEFWVIMGFEKQLKCTKECRCLQGQGHSHWLQTIFLVWVPLVSSMGWNYAIRHSCILISFRQCSSNFIAQTVHLGNQLRCRFWSGRLGWDQDSALPKGRSCWCSWPMDHSFRSRIFRDFNKKDLILTDQVGREGRELLFCCNVIQAFHFNGTLHIGIHNRSSHFGFLHDLLKVPKNNFLNFLEHKWS